ncbi:hypothetical protein JCM3775_004004 [Rhodotorula graminis]
MAALLWRSNTHGEATARGADSQGASVGKDTSTLYDLNHTLAAAAAAAAPQRAPSPAPSSSLRKARSAFDLSPRLGTTDDGFFSWKRWYGATSAPPQAAVTPVPSSDEVSRLVRDALRRRREADDDVSLASSAASSQLSDASTDSPASSSGTWDTSASESSKAAAVPSRSSGYDQQDLDGLPTLAYGTCASPSAAVSRLRAAQSVATLKAPRMIRRVSSSASISPVPVELPPRSPHAVTSPTFSPLFDDDPFATLAEASAFPPPSPTLEPLPTSFRSRLASSLRKSASSITLRNPLRSSHSSSSPAPAVPALPAAHTAPPSAAAILRDLLLKHDSVVDPSTEPLSSLFDPTLAPPVHDDNGDDNDEADDARRYYSSSSDDEPDGLYSSDESASSSSHHTDVDDDPFRATAPAHLAWMAPTGAAAPARGVRAAPEDEPGALDSPSSAFPPFDPFALADLGHAPPLPFALARAQAATPQRARPRPPPPPPARIITKQRSFVDPRTRQLRTAPSVCVTPSTPEKKRFALGGEREVGSGAGGA